MYFLTHVFNSLIRRIELNDLAGINSAPVISNLPLSTPVTVQENSPLSSSVYQVLITDVDVGQNHTFQVYSTPSIGSTLFSIDSTSKQMMTSVLKKINCYKTLSCCQIHIH